MVYEGQVISEMTLGEVVAISKRYADQRQVEAEAAELRRIRSLEVLEQVTVILSTVPRQWGTMKCMICGASVEGVINPKFSWVTRVPHANECPAFVLSQIVSEPAR